MYIPFLEAILFFYLYSIVSVLSYLAALPFLFLFSFKPKYKISIPARFFLWKNPPLTSDGIWFHSCSFGEAKAIKPIVEVLPKEKLRMTTTTQTGKEVIDTYTSQSRYLPYEPLLFGWLRPQKALVVMEAEFWYLLFALAQRRGAKTLLINARMSDRSFPKYQRISWLYRHIFKHIDEVYAQTAQDKKRLESLGARHVVVTGNIKLAQLPKVTRRLVRPDGPVICGASTHQGEEHLILQAFAILKEKEQNARLIIVPRHPERFERVAAEIEVFASSYGFSWHAFSKDKSFNTDITIVDRLGELVNIYAISDIVILGGAFEPVGGHNAAEAAQFGCKIISGPHYFNQKDIFSAVKGIKIIEAEALERTLLAYEALPETEIIQRSDISPILQSLTQISK